MKTNVPKRKVFQDAVDLLGVPEISADTNQMMIPVDKIVPFHNHPFRLYEGERLDDMVASIKEHGVLSPVIVLKQENEYEMLAGHNRWNAAKIAGVKEIPAIVKRDLSEEEAYVYVIETNLMQRSFTDLLPSEKAAVLAERYDKVLYQRHREVIISELRDLEGDTKGGHDVHLSKNRDAIGEDYGMTGRNIARYMRLNQTIGQIKEMVDTGTMTLVVAVELSYLTEEEQKMVCAVVVECGIKIKSGQAEMLHKSSGDLTEDLVKEILVGKTKENTMSDAKVFAQIKKKYFKGKTSKEVSDILEQALEAWFAIGEV